MGGYGSGRKFGAECTEDYQSIDIRRWQRDGYLMPGRYIDCQWSRYGEKISAINAKIKVGRIRLIYNYRRNGGEWESLDYPVRLQTTACNYGGVRYWFTCPAVGCGRRIAVLYLGGKIFACRHCYQLVYKSQRETVDDRAARRANKIRAKLNWEPGILNGNGWKPKGMHWLTYDHLVATHENYSNQLLMGITAKLGIVTDRGL
ncbi:conserved hypothetical protein [Candidatus Methylobacter favarea]|uniref:Uncharacterized protein n=1 Tax=Candidatus Methylobacter favarea TaxID=2707345 RepID=A0A8S0WZT0_9GAMM|nr:hypothetical protein [Candidatus Methylobacter favarea]CAA9890375.1 conserved hypothetical protein [Candidatus Methylobacter favarea]